MVNMTFLPNLQNMAPVSYCIYTELCSTMFMCNLKEITVVQRNAIVCFKDHYSDKAAHPIFCKMDSALMIHLLVTVVH